MSHTYIPYDEVGLMFDEKGASATLDHLIDLLKHSGDYHGLFRMLLLKKRYELKFPLVNPGDLKGVPPEKRKAYEDYAAELCRHVGNLFLQEHNLSEAWRYYRTLGEKEPVREALDKLRAEYVTDEILQIALDQAVHPKRGFELVLERHGICRAITIYDAEFTTDLEVKKYAAGLLVRKLYNELVDGVKGEIHSKFGDFPPENDLIELIRSRPWLFENGNSHADVQHVAAVARIGLFCEPRADLIKTLSIAEYGRMLDLSFQLSFRAPFTEGFDDCAVYARALLGQNVDVAVETFKKRVVTADPVNNGSAPAELLAMLLWRSGRKQEALTVWDQYMVDQPKELPGFFLPSFYELCLQAGEFTRLADCARELGDSTVWAAACMHRVKDVESKAEAAPAPVAKPAVQASEDLS